MRQSRDVLMGEYTVATAELNRLAEAAARGVRWRRWGPCLSERQWGTVRKDPIVKERLFGLTTSVPAPRGRQRARATA